MYVSASESRFLSRIFGLLSEDLSERDVRDTEPSGGASILRLSVRELEIARMIADDLCDKEIACRLGVEVSTVRTYLNRIFAKLGVRRGVAGLFSKH